MTKSGVQVFTVEIAKTEQERATGLMYRKELPEGDDPSGTIYGQVYEAGVTPNIAAAIYMELGLGAYQTDPSSDPSWTWSGVLPGDIPTVNAESNNEYNGTLTTPATPGTYSYTTRASLDGVNAPICSHLDRIEVVDLPETIAGCEECLKIGGRWLHLRMCETCGHIACCDSSPNKHASKHAAEVGHPIVRSAEPGEDWSWCYVDELMFRLVDE